MKCPLCDSELRYVFKLGEIQPAFCERCDKVWMIGSEDVVTVENMIIQEDSQLPVEIPDIAEGTPVYVDNREHKLFLEQGTVIKRQHKHYRVKLRSLDDQVNDRLVWFPEHWIKRFPREML